MPGADTRADLTERWHDVEERTAQEIANLETEVRDRVAARVAASRAGLGGTVNRPIPQSEACRSNRGDAP